MYITLVLNSYIYEFWVEDIRACRSTYENLNKGNYHVSLDKSPK